MKGTAQKLPKRARALLYGTALAAGVTLVAWTWVWVAHGSGYAAVQPGSPQGITRVSVLLLLAALAVGAQHFPLELGARRKTDVSISTYFAALLLYGPAIATVFAATCQLAGQGTLALRRQPSGRRRRSPRSVLFNVSQMALATALGGVVFAALVPRLAPAPLERWQSLWMVPLVALTMYVANTGAVALIAGFQQGHTLAQIAATWLTGRQADAAPFGAMFLTGLVAARVVAHDAWVIVAMALPLIASYFLLKRASEAEALAKRDAELAAREGLDRLKNEFLRTISHELRTPLTLIIGYAELLHSRTETLDRETMHQMIEQIDGGARQLTRLVEELLDFASLERGEQPLRSEVVDLAPLLSEVVAGLQGETGGERLSLHAPGPLLVHGDRDRLAHAVVNLIDNALAYAPEGAIVVRGQRIDGVVRVEVQDEGPGIPYVEQSRVWEKFYRGAGVAELSQGAGGGIGLAVVKSIAEAQGGTVGLQSDPGRGTCVWFEVPAATALAGAVLSPESPPAGSPSSEWAVAPSPGPASALQSGFSD